jgi:hypothetical protein
LALVTSEGVWRQPGGPCGTKLVDAGWLPGEGETEDGNK